jgi:hypothetical protein
LDITTTKGEDMTGSSTQGAKTLLHPVSDVEKAKAVYTALLGVTPQVADAYYIGSKPRASTSGSCRAADRRA